MSAAPNAVGAASPATENIQHVRASLLRDFIFQALAPVEHDSASVRHCLNIDDDAGARYHLKRVVDWA